MGGPDGDKMFASKPSRFWVIMTFLDLYVLLSLAFVIVMTIIISITMTMMLFYLTINIIITIFIVFSDKKCNSNWSGDYY